MFAVALALAVFMGLASADRAFAATVNVCAGTALPTIKDGVAAANSGDTIQVCAGTYPEQVVIPAGTTNLTLHSTTHWGAIIKAALPAGDQGSAIVAVHAATGITIDGFTITGPASVKGGQGNIGFGVLIDGNSHVTLMNNHITEIRDDPLTGAINGWAVRASASTLVATGNTVDNYQRNGIDLRSGAVGTITGNTVAGSGPDTLGGPTQNGIVLVGAAGTVTGNKVRENAFRGPTFPDDLATGIVVVSPSGPVNISGNKLTDNDIGINIIGATGVTASSNKPITGGLYGVKVEKDSTGNTFDQNAAAGASEFDCRDDSTGGLTAGTANTWTNNSGDRRFPDGICKAAIRVPVPPLVVLPGTKVIPKMTQNQLRSCVVEVRVLGPSRALVASGAARAPSTGAGRLVVRINIKPKGKTLLSKHFGGVIGNVRAICRSTDGNLHRIVKRVRIVLLIEHRLTPPGSWLPDQPILTRTGRNFMRQLSRRMHAARLIKCDGFTATFPPSPAHPPTLSLHRAKRVCGQLKRFGPTKARVRLVPHGKTDPIATNSTEAGRRVNRRVFVTIIHVVVVRS